MPVEIYGPLLRAVFAFILLMIVLRFLGKKAISQFTVYDFGIAVTLGSVTANLAIGASRTWVSATTVLITLAILALASDYLHLKSFSFRKIINSKPLTAIENGKIIDANLEKARVTVDELMTLLRNKNVFNTADVEFAILETNGELSVLPKSQKQPLTPADLKLPTSYKGLTANVIIDGVIIEDSLKASNLDKQWLYDQLSKQGISDVGNVLYAGLDTSGTLYVSLKGTKPGQQDKLL